MNEGPSSTGNAQVPDIAALISEHDPLNNPESEEFKTASAYVRAMIWMAQADENAMKAGEEPFEYETEEIRVLCGAWLTAWKRAKVSPPVLEPIRPNLVRALQGLAWIPADFSPH